MKWLYRESSQDSTYSSGFGESLSMVHNFWPKSVLKNILMCNSQSQALWFQVELISFYYSVYVKKYCWKGNVKSSTSKSSGVLHTITQTRCIYFSISVYFREDFHSLLQDAWKFIFIIHMKSYILRVNTVFIQIEHIYELMYLLFIFFFPRISNLKS